MYDQAFHVREEIRKGWEGWGPWHEAVVAHIQMEMNSDRRAISAEKGNAVKMGYGIVREMMDCANNGDLYYVTPDIFEIIQQGEDAVIDEVERIMKDENFTTLENITIGRPTESNFPGQGIIYFDPRCMLKGESQETRLRIGDDGERYFDPVGERYTLRIVALQWSKMIGSRSDPDDERKLIFCITYAQNRHGAVVPYDVYMWPVNYPYGVAIGFDWEFAPATRLYAFWEFIRQRISVVATEQPSRAYRKRAAKQNKAPESVRVVYLRRKDHVYDKRKEEREQAHVDWSCRWTVARHPRKQWYPSTKEHHLIWIDAYTKGPEDRPLKEGSAKKLFAVNR